MGLLRALSLGIVLALYILSLPLQSLVTPSPSPSLATQSDPRPKQEAKSHSPIFPIGIYHLSWDSTPEQMLADLRRIREAGFNTIHASYTPSNGYDAFLAEADRLQVRVITEILSNQVDVIRSYKDKPAVYGWNIADDAHVHYTPQEARTLHEQVKAVDGEHATYIVLYDPEKFDSFMGLSDIVAVLSYPIPDAPLRETDYVFEQAHIFAKARKQTIWGIPQAFSWPNKRAPTRAEMRNITYQMLINGAQGLLFYTYREQSYLLPTQNPQLWREIGTLTDEVEQLQNTLLHSSPEKMLVTDKNGSAISDILAGLWTYQDKALLVALNTSYISHTVQISIPVALYGDAKPQFPDRPASLQLSNNFLRGTLGPTEVQVYLIDTVAPLLEQPTQLPTSTSPPMQQPTQLPTSTSPPTRLHDKTFLSFILRKQSAERYSRKPRRRAPKRQ